MKKMSIIIFDILILIFILSACAVFSKTDLSEMNSVNRLSKIAYINGKFIYMHINKNNESEWRIDDGKKIKSFVSEMPIKNYISLNYYQDKLYYIVLYPEGNQIRELDLNSGQERCLVENSERMFNNLLIQDGYLYYTVFNGKENQYGDQYSTLYSYNLSNDTTEQFDFNISSDFDIDGETIIYNSYEKENPCIIKGTLGSAKGNIISYGASKQIELQNGKVYFIAADKFFERPLMNLQENFMYSVDGEGNTNIESTHPVQYYCLANNAIFYISDNNLYKQMDKEALFVCEASNLPIYVGKKELIFAGKEAYNRYEFSNGKIEKLPISQ